MSSAYTAPSASTFSMSSDRSILGKIVGHLYIAAKMILDGHVCSMDEVRHEIRALMNRNSNNYAAIIEVGEAVADPTSVLAFQKLVIRLMQSIRRIGHYGVPDSVKKDLARLIKTGKALCSGGGASGEAKSHIAKAKQLYQKLSGMSYL